MNPGDKVPEDEDTFEITFSRDKAPVTRKGKIKGTYKGVQDENLSGLLRNLFLLGLFAYIVPVVLTLAVFIGAGIGIAYLIWGH